MEELYRQLNTKFGLGNSKYLTEIWQILCTDEEAETANVLPGTADDISAKTGTDINDTNRTLLSLFKKGVAFKSTTNGKTKYKLAKNIVQFHDASLLWEGATQEYYDLWKKVMDEDFTGFMKSLPDTVKLPSFMRVIPVHESIEPQTTVLTYEQCAKIIEESDSVAVVKCPCRLSQRNCNAPLEACIQVNRGAEYTLDRGHGRKITKQEALEILKRSEEAGLVHMVENRSRGNVICNCCSCCCEMFRLMKSSGKKWILAPSRFLASISEECTSCGACVEVCPVNAIAMNGIASVKADDCMGCGLCATVCPVSAVTLGPVRPEGHIPV
ncbi:MAG: hypothetical protein A2176_13065 [Spirochaetes bacterium RBG_13_51_14]|nr:MAG: hypothetical protein A2176_13065 [Spirochaetes bacterium RBG_13_51_14]